MGQDILLNYNFHPPLSINEVITSRYCMELLIHLLPAAGLS